LPDHLTDATSFQRAALVEEREEQRGGDVLSYHQMI
jgi:hypothetical protein